LFNDPVVLAHARALLTSDPRGATGYLDADARDTGKILAGAAELLDSSEPVTVMLIAILQLITDEDDPYRLVTELVAAVPSGGFLAVTHVAGDMGRMTPGALEAARRLSELLPSTAWSSSSREGCRFSSGGPRVTTKRPHRPPCWAASPGNLDAPRGASPFPLPGSASDPVIFDAPFLSYRRGPQWRA
jgi:hypothetical protein